MTIRERAEITNIVISEIKTELINAGINVDEAHTHIDRSNRYAPTIYIRVWGEYNINNGQQIELLSSYNGIMGSVSLWDDDDNPTHQNYTIMIMLDQS